MVKGLGVTSLTALHDLNLAAHHCDRIFLLHEGQVCASGTPVEVLQLALIRQVYGVDVHVEQHFDALAAQGIAIVLSTHDLTVAQQWADQVALMGAGQIVIVAPPHELCAEAEWRQLVMRIKEQE